MDALDQLGLIAEISATYSGFIAVFLVFSRGDGRFSPEDGNFIQAMILSTLGAVMLALMPRVFSLLLPADLLWPVCTWIAVSGLVVGFSYQAWWQIRIPKDVASALHYVWHIPGWVIASASIGAFVPAAFQVTASPGFYVLGTALLMGLGVWSFMAIVFRKLL